MTVAQFLCLPMPALSPPFLTPDHFNVHLQLPVVWLTALSMAGGAAGGRGTAGYSDPSPRRCRARSSSSVSRSTSRSWRMVRVFLGTGTCPSSVRSSRRGGGM